MIRLLVVSFTVALPAFASDAVDEATAARFAKLALACVHKEYPNKLAHVLNGPADAKTPARLTPAFYGCYDWHSAVHGHWTLVRLIRTFPTAPFASPARAALERSLSATKLEGERRYLEHPDHASFEVPYGMGWLLTLHRELCEWEDADARRWCALLAPLAELAGQRVLGYLSRLPFPVRSGEHDAAAFAVLEAYGIPAVSHRLCRDWSEVQTCAVALGFPVVLKISSATLLHKTEAQGVRLNLRNRDELASAYLDLETRLRALQIPISQTQFMLQKMISGGRETLIGIHAVPQFGSVVAFGLGGIYVEALKDVALRVVPLCREDAEMLVQSLRGQAILHGVRGEAPVAFEKLHEILLRVSQLAQDFPEIIEMDMNPFLLFHEAEKCMAVDVRMRIKSAEMVEHSFKQID